MYNIFENHDTQRNLVKSNQAKIFEKAPEVKRGFSKSEESVFGDMIQKGEISDSLASGYGPGSQAINFAKTGKEIKEKAPSILAALAVQKATIEAQLSLLQESAGIMPTSGTSRRYDKNFSLLRYEYKVCEPKYLGDGNYEESTAQMGYCNKYNSLCYILCDVLDDIDAMNIIVKNVEDTKKYSLSVSQLIALNFS